MTSTDIGEKSEKLKIMGKALQLIDARRKLEEKYKEAIARKDNEI